MVVRVQLVLSQLVGVASFGEGLPTLERLPIDRRQHLFLEEPGSP